MMKKFALVYLGGNYPSNEEEAKSHHAKYVDWLKSLGNTAAIPMIPLKDTTTVSRDGSVKEGGSCAMSGFSIIQAETMAGALAVAQTCPFLEIGGSLEVSEIM